MNKLNMGCGYVMPDGWENVDLLDYGNNVVADLLDRLPYPDDHFDYIVSNHTLQMIRFDDLPRALAELRRVLKPDGVMRTLVPDADGAAHSWIDMADGWEPPISEEIEGTRDGRFLRYLFWHGDARSAFTSESLAETLLKAGFSEAHDVRFGLTNSPHPEIASLDSREDESIVVEAIK